MKNTLQTDVILGVHARIKIKISPVALGKLLHVESVISVNLFYKTVL